MPKDITITEAVLLTVPSTLVMQWSTEMTRFMKLIYHNIFLISDFLEQVFCKSDFFLTNFSVFLVAHLCFRHPQHLMEKIVNNFLNVEGNESTNF